MAKDKEGDEKTPKKAGTRLIKYMGGSDVREIRASDNFGGRLPDGFGFDAKWNEENAHVVEFEGLDDDAAELLLEQQERDGSGVFVPAFQDVTGMRRVPDNVWQQRWRPRGLPDARSAGAVVAPNTQDVPVTGANVGAGPTTGAGGSGTGGVGPAGSTV